MSSARARRALEAREKVKTVTSWEATPSGKLWKESALGKPSDIETLLESKADPNELHPHYGTSALMRAAVGGGPYSGGNLTVVNLLLNKGADPRKTTPGFYRFFFRDTALDLAKENYNQKCVVAIDNALLELEIKELEEEEKQQKLSRNILQKIYSFL